MFTRKALLGLAGFTLTALLLVFLVIRVLDVRQASIRLARVNTIKQVGLAIHNFCQANKRFPPSVFHDELGRPLGSWRFHLLPYLESMMIDIPWNEPWDSPDHRWLSRKTWAYCLDFNNQSDERAETNVLAVTGPGTAFDDEHPVASVPDNLILVVEAAHTGIHWMEPGDLQVDNLPPSTTKGLDGKGFLVLFANGEVWYLRFDIPLPLLKSFFTVDSARIKDRNRLLKPYGYLVR